jgi:hypothetical protein
MIVKNAEPVAVLSGLGRSSNEIDQTQLAFLLKCNELTIL